MRSTLSGDGTTLLKVEHLEVVYHHMATAVQGVSFSVPSGSVVVLLGPNGAGKTTVLRAISGFTPADVAHITKGAIIYRGERVEGTVPEAMAKQGVVLVPERDKVFETLTTEENLRAVGGRVTQENLEQVYELFPPLWARRHELAGFLSGGERQMLAIGAALVCQPSLLLVDEPSLGLAPSLVSHLFANLHQLNQEHGITILMVEQNARGALNIADYGYIIESGRVVFEGPAEALQQHEDVMEFYLGQFGPDQNKGKTYRDVKQYRRKRRWWA
jgi:branched-chain amino acid transport system ATP-binding protein